MKSLVRKLCAPILLGLMLLGGASMPTRAQERVQTGVTTVAYHPHAHFYVGFGPPYPYYPYGYPYGYYGRWYGPRHYHRW